MRVNVPTAAASTECKPYPDLFPPAKSTESIKTYAFPVVARPPAEKCHGTPDWSQKGSRCSFVHEGEDKAILDSKDRLSRAQIIQYSIPAGIVELNKKGMSLAMERRFGLFIQQAIVCYGMSDFVFSARGADGQIGTSPAIRLSSPGSHSTTLKREAAHSSTIPTLIAHAKDGSTPGGIVYLKGGSSYFQHQATVGMHECVNGADELIDGNGNDRKLRARTIEILNRVADGLSPIQATQEFCATFAAITQVAAARLGVDDGRKLVLQHYARKIAKIQQATAHSPVLYDRLLGVVINPGNPHEQKLRDVVYKKRYDVIRLQEVIENRIGKRMADTMAQMGTGEKSYLEHILLKEFAGTDERQIIEKLLGKTVAYLEADDEAIPPGLKSFRTRVENLRTKHRAILTPLLRDLRADFRELSLAEFTYRAGVFKDLRTKVNDWRQIDFCDEYLKTTGRSVSKSWVSRMEQLSRLPRPAGYSSPLSQRRRYVSIEDGVRCARTFGVDAGLFLPCLFTSFHKVP